MDYVVYYLLIVNVVAFLLYGLDKRKAIKGQWRIPEKVLLGMAVIGGAIGALFGMLVFHHKIRKWKFMLGVPVILILQIVAVCYVVSFVGR